MCSDIHTAVLGVSVNERPNETLLYCDVAHLIQF